MAIGKITKIEVLLLVMTGLFLCGLLALSSHDQRQAGEIETAETAEQESFMPDVSPVDLNTATAEDLVRLPGIGEELAQRILEYRASVGEFTSPEELMNVSGIGEAKFSELKERVTVEIGSEAQMAEEGEAAE